MDIGSGFSVEAEDTINLPSHHGNPEHLFCYIFVKKDLGFGYRVLMVNQDHSATLLSQAGEASINYVFTLILYNNPILWIKFL